MAFIIIHALSPRIYISSNVVPVVIMAKSHSHIAG
jgi:hypothetical protein